MQRQWTIKVRGDFADPGKYDIITEAVKRAWRELNATGLLLGDGVKFEAAAFSDDFYVGHEDYVLVEDAEHEGVSSEMLDAVRDMKGGA